MHRFLPFLLLLVVTTRADLPWTFTGTTNVVATEAAFTNAYYTIPDNWLVMVGAGSFTLNTSLDQTRAASVSVQGTVAGTNLMTTITMPNTSAPWVVENGGSAYMLFADLNIIGAANNSFGALFVGKNIPATVPLPAFVEVARVQMTNTLSRGIDIGASGFPAWVHDCYFSYPAGAGQFNGIITRGNEYDSWDNANPLGTTNQVVVDNSTFLNLSGGNGNGHFDTYNGASTSFRHCLFIGDANTGTHGYDSQVTSTRTLEVIACTFTNLTSGAIPLETRGGVLTTVSNTFSGTLGTNDAMYLNYYRSCWGAYQGSLGFQGYLKTNTFAGTALSATAGSLTATNVPGSAAGKQLSWYTAEFNSTGRTISITGGTGSGQVKTILASSITSQSVPGTVTFTIVGTFSPVPDATSTFEILYANGSVEQIGNQPNYTFTTGALSANRQVKVGANLAESISNLVSCINLDPAGAGTRYYAGTTNNANGRNLDFLVTAFNATSLTLTNILDGTGVRGYAGAQAPGVLTVTKYTNSPITLYPCISMANYLNGTNVGYNLRWTVATCTGPEFNTNSVVLGRDYYNTNSVPYTLLAYPYPGSGTNNPPTSIDPPVVVTGNVILRGAVRLRVGN